MPDTMTVGADTGAGADSRERFQRAGHGGEDWDVPAAEAQPDRERDAPGPSGRWELDRGLRALRLAFWGAALLLGAFDAWYPRFSTSFVDFFPDALAYIDIAWWCADGGWSHLLNSYWSPLYPGLLAAAFRLLQPSAAAEFPVVHLVNMIIFVAAFGSFDFLWRTWLEDHRARSAAAGRTGSLPPWSLLAIGYSVFLWSSICWISVQGIGADLLVAALTYLAAGLTLRLRRGGSQPRVAALLGAVLGLGFLAKAAMLPLALVFLLVAFLRVTKGPPAGVFDRIKKGPPAGVEHPPRSKNGSCGGTLPDSAVVAPRRVFDPARLPRRTGHSLLAAGIAFLVITGPFVYGLSRQEGRLTFGDSGRLNYAWWVNGVQQFHWQGEPPGHGKPVHPTRLIHPSPPVYEFAGPIGGTFPVWTDPTYWCEGIEVHFNGRQQAQRLLNNLTVGRRQLPLKGPALLVVVGLVLLLTTVLAARRGLLPLVRWDLLLLAVAPVVLYALVVVESRYLGPSVVLLGLALLPAVRLPAHGRNRAMVALTTALILLIPALGLARVGPRGIARRSASQVDWDTATALHSLGIRPGDRVGCIGLSTSLAWARLARVSVVAEIPKKQAAQYWDASPAIQAAALGAFATAGVRAVVTRPLPPAAAPRGWHRLGVTDRYVRLLNPPTAQALTTPSPRRR